MAVSTLRRTTEIKVLTTCGSNWLPALSTSSRSATSRDMGARYGRSVVMALNASQQAMIRAGRGMDGPDKPSG